MDDPTGPEAAIGGALHCLECGYDLAGLPVGHRCPECGTPFEHAALLAEIESRIASQQRAYGQALWAGMASLLAASIAVLHRLGAPLPVGLTIAVSFVFALLFWYRLRGGFDNDAIQRLRLDMAMLALSLLLAGFLIVWLAFWLAIGGLLAATVPMLLAPPTTQRMARSLDVDRRARLAAARRSAWMTVAVAAGVTVFSATLPRL